MPLKCKALYKEDMNKMYLTLFPENISFTYKCRVPDVDHICLTASESLENNVWMTSHHF